MVQNWLIILVSAGIGAMIGAVLGFIVCAMLAIRRDEDDDE